MSEISDAVQIMRVAFDGVEVIMKLGNGSLELMQKFVSLVRGMLSYEKQMGRTNMKKLLMRGGDLQVLQFAKEDMKKVDKLCRKYGVLYSVMPDLDRTDGLCEVMFHSEAAPRVQMMIQKMKSDRMKVSTMDDFLQNGNKEQLSKLMKFFEEQRRGNSDIHTDNRFDSLIDKVGRYAVEKQSVSVENIVEDFQLGKDKANELVGKLQTIGVVDKPDDSGRYKVIMERNDFESRMKRYKELTDRMRMIAANRNTSLNDITIAMKMVEEENDHAIKTRIPTTWGNNAMYIWINKSDVMEVNNGKTLLTYLDDNKDYKIYSADNRVISTLRGDDLYAKYYDPVETQVKKRYEAEMKKAAVKRTPAPERRR